MLFSSFSFLFWFLPAVLLLYFLPELLCLGGRVHALIYRNAVLLVASLFFYAWGEPVLVLLMVFTAGANALLALAIPRTRHPSLPFWGAVVLDLALLAFFKYPPLLGLAARPLPLGISFYTFQAISYVADVYTGRVPPAKNPLHVGLYISLFPQLVAGPIVRYTDISHALYERTHTVSDVAAGTQRFVVGLGKKVLLANTVGTLFAAFSENGTSTAVGAWLALLGFTFQIYFDFSGYSDMAVGLGRIFGFPFPENFNYPYIARSVSDFWRRWHITLSSFFREYVYFPLGGSRRGRARTVFNLLAVWALTGLWHGASWNFLLWGLYYFLLLVAEKFLLGRPLSALPDALALPLTLLCTMGGWLLFFFDGSTAVLRLSELPRFVATLLGRGAGGLAVGADLYDLVRHLPLLLLCALGATPLPKRLFSRLFAKKGWDGCRIALCVGCFLLSVAALCDASFNPFLYFRF